MSFLVLLLLRFNKHMYSVAALVTGHQRPCKLPPMHMQCLSCQLQSDVHVLLSICCMSPLKCNLHAWWVRDRYEPRHTSSFFLSYLALIPFLMLLTRQQLMMPDVVRDLLD